MKTKIVIFLAMLFVANGVFAGIFKQDPVITAMCMDNDLLSYATDYAKHRVYYKNDAGEDKILVTANVVRKKWRLNPVRHDSWVLKTSVEFAMDIKRVIESLPRNLPPKVLALHVRQACLDGNITPTFHKVSLVNNGKDIK